jgi:hypothetical protein
LRKRHEASGDAFRSRGAGGASRKVSVRTPSP